MLLLVAEVAPPDATETSTTTVTFPEGPGGMTPDAPVLLTVAVEPAVDSVDSSRITVIVGSVLGPTVKFEIASIDREARVLAPVPKIGVMMPLPPVETDVKVLPAAVILPLPNVTVGTVEFDAPVGAGGMTPSPPVALRVYVEPEVENWVPPVETTVNASSEIPAVEFATPGLIVGGGITPALAVEYTVKVPPETVALPAPSMESDEFPDGDGKAVGGIISAPPVEVPVAREKNVVTSPLPSVVDAGTNVGGVSPPPPIPPPFVKTLVDVPEMIVVVAPLMMVVISTE